MILIASKIISEWCWTTQRPLSIISSAVLTTNSININSQACPACWHRSHSPADPAPSGILPYPPTLNPKPWGAGFQNKAVTQRSVTVSIQTLFSSTLVAPHGTSSVLSAAKGSSQWWWWHNCDLSTVAHFKVKKREPRTGLSAYLCVCVHQVCVSAGEWHVLLFLKTDLQSQACAAESRPVTEYRTANIHNTNGSNGWSLHAPVTFEEPLSSL